LTVPVRARGPFPRLVLHTLAGDDRSLDSLWAQDRALVLIGHRSCPTTRLTLPFVDRIHRRRGKGKTVVVVLQDDAQTARTLVAEQGLEVPVLLEDDPYPLAKALALAAVPTLILVDAGGSIEKVVEGFNRSELEALGERLGAPPPLFVPEDQAPAFRPG
jgi:hypothetical protein